MNNSLTVTVAVALISDLRSFAGVCEETLCLAQSEYEALTGAETFDRQEFDRRRKELLPGIESLLRKFRGHRATWENVPQSQREQFRELKQLFERIQNLMMKVLLLDRENQQAMLKRGMVPVNHLPKAATRRPHYVADLYRKNSSSGT